MFKKLKFFMTRGLLFLIIIAVNGCAAPFLPDGKIHVHPSIFHYAGPAQSVCITGDFNQWSLESHCLRQINGIWTIGLMLPPGVHRYAFIINKRQWVVDPKALFLETDGFGRQNAVAVVN